MALKKLAKDHVEILLSVAALITAVAAVFIATEQTKVMQEEAALERERHKIAVMPSVWVSTFINRKADVGEFKLVFSNRGLGPAVIERFDIVLDGQPAKNWDHLVALLAKKYAPEVLLVNGYVHSNRSPISPGMFIEAGHEAVPFAFSSQGQSDVYTLVTNHFQTLEVSLCYCALYGGCYVANLFERPAAVDHCVVDDDPFISHTFVKQQVVVK